MRAGPPGTLGRRKTGVVGGRHEAGHEPAVELAHVAASGVQRDEVRLVATSSGVGRRTADHLGPVRRQSLDVLRVLARMGERVIELRVGQTAAVVRLRRNRSRSNSGVTPEAGRTDPSLGFGRWAQCCLTRVG
jgi:hypothetical protein